MRIIVEHGTRKREIEGPFNIMLDTESFWALWKAMRKQRRRMRKRDTRFHYGWLYVSQEAPVNCNTNSEPWDDTPLL